MFALNKTDYLSFLPMTQIWANFTDENVIKEIIVSSESENILFNLTRDSKVPKLLKQLQDHFS